MRGKITFLILFSFSLLAHRPPKIPNDPRGVIWCPQARSFWNDADLITAIVTDKDWVPLEKHGYKTYRSIEKNSLKDFLNMFREIKDKDTLRRDYIALFTHGGDSSEPEWLAIEFYSTKDSAKAKVRSYIKSYPDEKNNIVVRKIVNAAKTDSLYTVSVNTTFLSHKLPSIKNAICYVGACYSSKIVPTFLGKGAMTGFGWNSEISTTENADAGFCIFKHMCGGVVSDRFLPRNKTAQEALNDYQNYYTNHPNRLHLGVFGNGLTKFYNSPRIVAVLVTQGDKEIYKYGFIKKWGKAYPYEVSDYPGDLSGKTV